MILPKPKTNDRVIDLTGPQGNAHYLIGLARNLAIQLCKDPNDISQRMMSSDYENLVKVFDQEYGHIYTLYR